MKWRVIGLARMLDNVSRIGPSCFRPDMARTPTGFQGDVRAQKRKRPPPMAGAFRIHVKTGLTSLRGPQRGF
jgi:hypothetical protein